MSLGTKAGGAVVAAIAIVAALTLLQTGKEELDKRRVTVTGMWLPSPRPDMVQVTVSVGSVTKTTRHINAPFGPQSHRVAPGTRVMIRLRLLGDLSAKFLGCIVAVDGHTEMETPPQRTSVAPGTEVMCWAVA